MANVQDRDPPSAAAIAIGTAIVAGVTGYFLGQASSIGLFGKSDTRSPAARLSPGEGEAKPDNSETESDDDDEEGEDDEDDDVQDLGELQTFPGNTEECKLVLVVRNDLGKLAHISEAQSHANGLAGMTKGNFSCSYLYFSTLPDTFLHYVFCNAARSTS
jgi:PTH2 family peptidyl-tRNA hydrolase